MRTGLPAALLRGTPSAIRDDRFTRCPFPAATTMPLWLWQEVQILPWSTEIVALTCGTRKRLRPVVPAYGKSLPTWHHSHRAFSTSASTGDFSLVDCHSLINGAQYITTRWQREIVRFSETISFGKTCDCLLY